MTRAPSRKHAGASLPGARPPLSPRGLPRGTFYLAEVDPVTGLTVREIPVKVEGWPYFMSPEPLPPC